MIAGYNAKLSVKDLNALKDYISKTNIKAEDTYRALWIKTYTGFPRVVLTCTSSNCVTSSTASAKTIILKGYDDLLAMSKNGDARIKAILKNAAKKKAPKLKVVAAASSRSSKLVLEAVSSHSKSKASLAKIPGTLSTCK
jgi:hypothetical protein